MTTLEKAYSIRARRGLGSYADPCYHPALTMDLPMIIPCYVVVLSDKRNRAAHRIIGIISDHAQRA